MESGYNSHVALGLGSLHTTSIFLTESAFKTSANPRTKMPRISARDVRWSMSKTNPYRDCVAGGGATFRQLPEEDDEEEEQKEDDDEREDEEDAGGYSE